MSVILEGTDGVGKTTIARSLESEGYLYIHRGIPIADTWEAEYLQPILDKPVGQPMVGDRWHLGEWVWPLVFNRPSLFRSWDDLVDCHKAITMAGVRTYLVTRSSEAIRKTLLKRGEDERNLADTMVGLMMFRDVADRLDVTIVESDLAIRGGYPWS